jgi:TolB-like protein/class 3 adenylate cyclase
MKRTFAICSKEKLAQEGIVRYSFLLFIDQDTQLSQSGVKRRLSAILAADVVGYSRLMGEDEMGTLERLKSVRRELVQPAITDCNGRIVKLMGDGLLAEFSSVVEAVQCAVAIQESVEARDPDMEDNQRIRLRIGVNLGDILIEGSDIYGDGVNVAARLEGLADAGGICISDTVRLAIGNKLPLEYEFMGEQSVKNIKEPINVYQIQLKTDASVEADTQNQNDLEISDKPSIAVLPFTNMSDDPEQEYFADGVVEEIITALARLSWLFVVARNSSFIYKGQAVDIKQVGRDLGVRYVLEGSIRKAGSSIRITGQLIDATTDVHLWADRYDGNLDNIFDLQDQITSNVVGAIAPKLEFAEIERIKHKPTSSLDAYDCYLRGIAEMYKWSSTGIVEALKHLYRAIEIDPDYGIAYAMAARCFNMRAVINPLEFGAEDVSEAERLCRLAADLGRNDAIALSMAGVTLGFAVRDVRGGAALTNRALTLNPNLAVAWYSDGWLQQWLGHPEIAIEHISRAIELSPQDPAIFQMQTAMAAAHFTAGDDRLALSWAEKALHDRPEHFPALAHAVISAAHLGLQTETEDFRDRILGLYPEMALTYLANMIPYQRPEHHARMLDGLRMAGFPE